MHTMINGLIQYWDATLFDYAIVDYHMIYVASIFPREASFHFSIQAGLLSKKNVYRNTFTGSCDLRQIS
jgi:hypothetical protein